VAGLPVQLQASTDGGKTYATRRTRADGADGKVAFAPVVGATTDFASAPALHALQPDVQDARVVDGAGPARVRPAPPVVDKTAPAVSKVRLSGPPGSG